MSKLPTILLALLAIAIGAVGITTTHAYAAEQSVNEHVATNDLDMHSSSDQSFASANTANIHIHFDFGGLDLK